MLQAGPALKVTIYLNQDTGSSGGFLHDDILGFLHKNGVEGATAFRAHAGFGFHRRLHTRGAGDVEGQHLPVVISFVDAIDRVNAIMPDLLVLVTDGLVEAHPTEVLKNITTVEKVLS